MKAFYLLGLLTLPLLHSAQSAEGTPPDYEAIKEEIENEDSKYNYATLMERYRAGDSTLSLEAARHLYYGYRFQPGYSPYGNSEAENDIKSMLAEDTLSNKTLEDIVERSKEGLAEEPFNFRLLNIQLYAMEQLGDTMKMYRAINQYNTIVDAILSSGDGLTRETAYYVIKVSHEYALLRALGFQFGGQQSLYEHRYDYLTLAENDYDIEGLYFEISASMDYLSQMMKSDD